MVSVLHRRPDCLFSPCWVVTNAVILLLCFFLSLQLHSKLIVNLYCFHMFMATWLFLFSGEKKSDDLYKSVISNWLQNNMYFHCGDPSHSQTGKLKSNIILLGILYIIEGVRKKMCVYVCFFLAKYIVTFWKKTYKPHLSASGYLSNEMKAKPKDSSLEQAVSALK